MAAREAGPAVECVDLTKVYAGGTTALDRLTLSIPSGASFGLLGENGAGKSTLVHLLLGLIFPTAGTVRVLGEHETARAHPRIGYVHERPAFETRMSAADYLTYLAQLAGLWGPTCRARVRAVLAQVDLETVATRRTGTFSKGMLQRLAIAQALLTDPDLLILDEPTSGLDPGGQWEVRQIIAALRQQGKTLLLCSHYLPEVEGLCDVVGILRRGRLVRHGPVADLLRVEDMVELVLAGDQPAAAVVERLALGPLALDVSGSAIRVRAAAQTEVLAALVRAGVPLRSLNPVTQTLEDVYVRATRRPPERVPVPMAGGPDANEPASNAGGAR
jgi:ABC-2 type transport system ATP-binding protein